MLQAYPGVNISDVRFGWGDTETTNLTVPSLLSESRIVVRAYPADEPGPRQLYLALNTFNLLPINASFLYYRQPTNFSQCEPTGGPTRGGTAVTIQGGPFDVFSTDAANTLCRFGGRYVQALVFESDRIVCETPPADTPGTVQVAVSLNGADTDFGLIGRTFKYYQQPRPRTGGGDGDLSGITPVGGPREGGTRVTILGSGFMAFAPVISFVRCRWQAPIVDVIAASNARTIGLPFPESSAIEHTDTRIVCLAPSARIGAAELVNLTLTLNALDFGDTGLTFQYYAPPRVTTITPSGGHRTGGTIVTISGEGFDVLADGAYVSCQYGSPYNPAYNARYTITRPSLVTRTAVVCNAPSTKVTDTRELWLALNGFALGSGRDPRATGQNYTYYNPPTVLSVLPQAGVFSGGTVVTLLGQGFHGLSGNKDFASCRFLTSNSISDTAPIELNPDFWTCRSPNQTGIAEGEAALVLVTLNAQQYVDTTYRFSYYGLRIDDVNVNGGPPGGVAAGATVVTLRGFGFDRGPVKYCRFGLLPRVLVLSVSAERLLCTTPPASYAGDVHLLLSNDDIVYIDTGLDYTYYVQPTIFSSVSPEGGPKRGDTLVTLTGSGFAAFVSQSQPLSPDDKRRAARCLWGGEFSSDLSVEGLLRNAPRTSPVASGALTMSGQAGVTAPIITAVVVEDPDNSDAVWSDGDTITIYFDVDTNEGGEGLLTDSGNRVLVDQLFAFSHALGARYSGRWLDASSFQVVVVDSSGSSLAADLSGASVAVIGDIKNANELSRWCKATSALSGSTGTQQPPAIAHFDSQTWDLQDVAWSRYDTLSVRFDVPTDLGGREGGKAFVDTTLSFSQSLGEDYSGVWLDPSTFLITILDPSGASGGPRINATAGAVVSVNGTLRNAPGTSEPSRAAYVMSVGDYGRSSDAPRLLRFFARDRDNANTSYDVGDELIVQFDMSVNHGACLEPAMTTDNLPTCMRRASGNEGYVDSLFSMSAPIGANYTGGWADGSTFVVTVTKPFPDAEHAPRPYDTVLKIASTAGITNLAGTAPVLAIGPGELGGAERVTTLPTPPRLVDAVASDFENRHLIPALGDTMYIRFNEPTDRAGGAFDELAGRLSCQSGDDCNLMNNQAHRLFDFFYANGVRITTPFFLEYTSGWLDDSTFAITVINGTKLLRPGIIASSWEPPWDFAHDQDLTTALADSGTRVALRAGIVVQSLSCPPEYAGSAYCTAPTGLSDTTEGSVTFGYEAPYLRGDFGRITGPEIVGFTADDPNNGDGVFGDGDVLTITFDQRTNRARTHDNFGRPYAHVISHGSESDVRYPLGTDGLSGNVLVDAMFDFSHPLGTAYSGEWLDDSTFSITVLDATAHDLTDPPTVGVLNVTARPSAGIGSFNLTAKTCANITHMMLYHPDDYANLLYMPYLVNSSLHNCEVHYANGTSPPLDGDLGAPTYPSLLSATADDVDNGDEVYGVGDVLVLQFDMPTNAPTALLTLGGGGGGGATDDPPAPPAAPLMLGAPPAAPPAGGGGDTTATNAYVDALFSFTQSLGTQYSGEWVRPDRFVVTIVQPGDGGVDLGTTEVTVVSTNIRNAAGDELTANNQTVVVHGDFGTLVEPSIERFTVVTEPNASTYADGDTVVIQISMLTNYGQPSPNPNPTTHAGNKAYVDHLFGFSHVLGADYSGSWQGGETPMCADGGATTLHPCFVVTLIDTSGGAALTGTTLAAPSIHLRSGVCPCPMSLHLSALTPPP